MNSKIILVKNIHLDRQYTNVLDYTEAQMLELCTQNMITQANDYSFIRTSRTIMTNFKYSDALKANYIAFQNPDYSNKWFFAWIDDVIYKGNYNTEISYTIDSWSTWFDYWKPKTCLVTREHVNNDEVGLHTVPENLEIGQLICDRQNILSDFDSESYYYFVIACNYDPSNETRTAGVGIYGEYPQGCQWFAWEINRDNYANTINEISQWLYDITVKEHADDIQSIFALPFSAFNIGDIDSSSHKVINGKGKKLNNFVSFSKTQYRSISGYTPKNNKLLVYPYSFIRVTNGAGSYNDYKIEDFLEYDSDGNLTDNMTFNEIGIPCIGYSGKLRPRNYQGIVNNEDESLMLGKYPTLSWSVDAFTNWLSQNSVNLTVGAISTALGSAISIGTSIAGGNISGAANGTLSLATNVANTFGSINQASMLPNTAQGNANAGDVNFAFNINRFKVLHLRPKIEYLKRLDDYFSRFGYKLDEVLVPNLNGRRYWNYIEIGSAEEIGYGEVPSRFMDIINNACRRGVTIWHNHSNIGNFNLDNSII